MDIGSFSLERLLRLAFQHGLITDYRISPDRVTLYSGTAELISCDPEEARVYLQGLLRGHSGAPGAKRSGKPPESSRRRGGEGKA